MATDWPLSAKFAAAHCSVVSTDQEVAEADYGGWHLISSCPTSCGGVCVRAHVSCDCGSWAPAHNMRAGACGRAVELHREIPSSMSCTGAGPPRTSPTEAYHQR